MLKTHSSLVMGDKRRLDHFCEDLWEILDVEKDFDNLEDAERLRAALVWLMDDSEYSAPEAIGNYWGKMGDVLQSFFPQGEQYPTLKSKLICRLFNGDMGAYIRAERIKKNDRPINRKLF